MGGLSLATSDYVVLGMIELGARSGYEIKRQVAASIRFFWTISEAQIYPGLVRLEAAGLVAGRSDPLGKRRRRTFEITEAGRSALQDWLRQTVPMPFELRDEGMVRLFFADALDADEARALLDVVVRRSQERIATLRAIEPASSRRRATHPLLTLRMGIAFHQAIIDVCRRFEAELGSARKSGPPKHE